MIIIIHLEILAERINMQAESQKSGAMLQKGFRDKNVNISRSLICLLMKIM